MRRAKEQCDYLIVGVSTDELVKEYKNKTPIIPYEERVEIIKAIRYVDEVVPQTHRDKYAAWEQYHFNRMFVGDDWKNSPLFNEVERKFKEVGVELVYFPYTQGTSSTLLWETISKFQRKE